MLHHVTYLRQTKSSKSSQAESGSSTKQSQQSVKLAKTTNVWQKSLAKRVTSAVNLGFLKGFNFEKCFGLNFIEISLSAKETGTSKSSRSTLRLLLDLAGWLDGTLNLKVSHRFRLAFSMQVN